MIEGYLGRVGAGKTYCMVADSLRYIGKSQIYANIPGLDWAEYFDSWEELEGVQNALVLIDELGLWANAREYKAFPKHILHAVTNSRKNGLHLRWTAQSEQGVDVTFRRMTANYFRHIRYGQFIRQTYEDAHSGKVELTRWIMLQEKVYNRYDTYAIVGDGSGLGPQRGAAAQAEYAKEKRRAEKIVAGAWVRNPLDQGGPVIRRATMDDLMTGQQLHKYDQDKGVMVAIDTREFRWSELIQVARDFVPAAASPAAAAPGPAKPAPTSRGARGDVAPDQGAAAKTPPWFRPGGARSRTVYEKVGDAG